MISEALNLASVRTELDDIFYQVWNEDASIPGRATALTAEIFKPLQITNVAHIEEIFKGSPLFSSIGEIGNVPDNSPAIGNKLTTYVKDFAAGISLSKDWFDDNMHGMWSKVVSDLARKARQTQNDNAFSFFRGAFTTSLTADGIAACGAHTTLSGATVTNTHTGAGSALSSTSINTGITDLAQQLDQAGVIMGNFPSILLVPTVLFKKARELTDSALIADTATNAINVYRSAYGFTVWTSPFLDAIAGGGTGSDTAWFMLSPNHSVTRLVRQGIITNLRDWSMSNNRTYFYQANFRETVYCPDYAGLTGFVGV